MHTPCCYTGIAARCTLRLIDHKLTAVAYKMAVVALLQLLFVPWQAPAAADCTAHLASRSCHTAERKHTQPVWECYGVNRQQQGTVCGQLQSLSLSAVTRSVTQLCRTPQQSGVLYVTPASKASLCSCFEVSRAAADSASRLGSTAVAAFAFGGMLIHTGS